MFRPRSRNTPFMVEDNLQESTVLVTEIMESTTWFSLKETENASASIRNWHSTLSQHP